MTLIRLAVEYYVVFLQIISYDSPRGGVSVITEKGDITASFLVVQLARPSDAGIYTCSPAIGKAVSVNVHVLRGEFANEPRYPRVLAQGI